MGDERADGQFWARASFLGCKVLLADSQRRLLDY